VPAVGAGIGLVDELLTAHAAVPSFVATPLSYVIAQGAALTMTAGQTILFRADALRATFATSAILGLNPALLWLVAAFLGHW
jgi:ribose/xylose/arabinose/galactoside ABC-type transport system permease subunit